MHCMGQTGFQSTINANYPGLNFNLIFWIMLFQSTVHFITLKKKVLLTQKIFVEKHVQLQEQAVEKFDLNI